jgi:hypothetical protein
MIVLNKKHTKHNNLKYIKEIVATNKIKNDSQNLDS